MARGPNQLKESCWVRSGPSQTCRLFKWLLEIRKRNLHCRRWSLFRGYSELNCADFTWIEEWRRVFENGLDSDDNEKKTGCQYESHSENWEWEWVLESLRYLWLINKCYERVRIRVKSIWAGDKIRCDCKDKIVNKSWIMFGCMNKEE